MASVDDLQRDYRAAFLRYLPRGEEAPLHMGYEIGRSAVVDGLSILDVVQVHHDVLLEVLRDTPRDDLPRVTSSASEFLGEVLATFDMTQRGFLAEG
ncbi:hypothetical protein GCM10009841_07900 [Microlunatus panaciterrae]|uniref:Phosphoserine phosphatase RsbU N-terminal domain-containing protein n=1 Tax=Microlunatus panaciterrae TaxID=400768 RepID=A0ABS2RK48_9ACTN|nr:phosphatase RsbU N-terminal domain-containing protein [Microlunatus panaciterrae]MBM7798556.1 hypothetical protein [Microlunatus panaciterrae]